MEIRKGDFPPKSTVPPKARLLAILYFPLSIFLVVSCASPGEPVERKPPTPTTITDLSATQIGNDVTLAFTLPRDSVEKRQLQQSPTIQVYRDFEAPPAAGSSTAAAAPAKPTLLLTIPSAMVDRYSVQGRVQFVDPLVKEDFVPADGREAVYTVRTFVSPKKISANSNVASLIIFPAPDPIANLKAEITPSGVALSWIPPQTTIIGTAPRVAFYRVYRAESGADATPATGASPAAAAENLKPKVPFARIAEPATPFYTDTQTELGKTYIYTVRTISQFPGVQLESLDSNLATVTPKDIFPPSAPQNLVIVFVPAATGAPALLEISWAINPETDIAGYNIYRAEAQGHPGTRLNSDLLLTPAFRDMNVVPGREYSYTVTAVDRSGNESPASASATGSIPAESQ
jgi:hypothetical protein